MSAEKGFSFLEVLVAVAIVGASFTVLTQLWAIATHANSHARRATIAAVLAAEKMEQLRSSVVDLDLDSGASLVGNIEGYCDFFDARGRAVGAGTEAPQGAAFIRRWSIAPLSTDPMATRVLQVLVMRGTASGNAGLWPAAQRLEDTHLVTIRTRKDR